MAEHKNPVSGVVPFFKKFLFWNRDRIPSHVEKTPSRKRSPLSPEKKAAIEKLCDQLFKQKKHITSGKFQFIGLTKIKKRMGTKWAVLCKIIYDTVEEVIDNHIGQSDVTIRYKDDTYVIIFARASLEEGQAIAAAIAEDIHKRLFALEENDLKNIEIRKAIWELRASFLTDQGFPDFLDFLEEDWETPPSEEEENTGEPAEIKITDVDAQDYRRETIPKFEEGPFPENISFSYIPLWDVPRNALTTYLCLPRAVTSGDDLLSEHKSLYMKLSPAQRVRLDIKTLEHVMVELASAEKDGRKLLIACAVHYETLYSFEDYELYKELLVKIPHAQKQFLVFVIFNMSEGLPPKNPYWFATPLRAFCRHVFAEVPLRRDINFNYMRNTGVDVVGVRLEGGKELEIINILNGFSAKAKTLKIPLTFVLGISSLSLATSAVCAGFDFLGGGAIHDAVGKPDTIHRFRHEDIISTLAQKK